MAKLSDSVSRTFSEFLILPGKTTRRTRIEEVSVRSRITNDIEIPLPFLSAAMQSVTGHELAIELAKHGGLGVVPGSLPVQEQADIVSRVKRYRSGFVYNVITVGPNDSISSILEIGRRHGYSTFPVTDNGRLVGLITEKRYHPEKDSSVKVRERMIPFDKLIVGEDGITLDQANDKVIESGIGALPIIDKERNLRSVVFFKDLKEHVTYPDSFVDDKKRLRVAAAVSTHPEDVGRAEALVKAGVDFLLIDASDLFSEFAAEAIEMYRAFKKPIIAGNIVHSDAFEFLAGFGVDCIKIGQGAGSICTTRRVKSTGRGQATAIMKIAKARDRFFSKTDKYIPICSDGGISSSGDMAVAFALGADLLMMGKYFAGFTESPQPLTERPFKVMEEGSEEISTINAFVKPYWGEASPRARNIRRYGHADPRSFVVEGVEGFVLHKGRLGSQLPNDIMAVKGSMSAAGCSTLREFYENVRLELQTTNSHSEGGTSIIS
ncbi:MAG: IMP dehydrogenase [Candidatus Aenigmarchaeota archaeon]|nr:IMP dehydrogenase [Candidatus Aenigmarchaeota archaeon]